MSKASNEGRKKKTGPNSYVKALVWSDRREVWNQLRAIRSSLTGLFVATLGAVGAVIGATALTLVGLGAETTSPEWTFQLSVFVGGLVAYGFLGVGTLASAQSARAIHERRGFLVAIDRHLLKEKFPKDYLGWSRLQTLVSDCRDYFYSNNCPLAGRSTKKKVGDFPGSDEMKYEGICWKLGEEGEKVEEVLNARLPYSYTFDSFLAMISACYAVATVIVSFWIAISYFALANTLTGLSGEETVFSVLCSMCMALFVIGLTWSVKLCTLSWSLFRLASKKCHCVMTWALKGIASDQQIEVLRFAILFTILLAGMTTLPFLLDGDWDFWDTTVLGGFVIGLLAFVGAYLKSKTTLLRHGYQSALSLGHSWIMALRNCHPGVLGAAYQPKPAKQPDERPTADGVRFEAEPTEW